MSAPAHATQPDAAPVIRARGLSKHFFAGVGVLDLLRGRLRGERIQALADVDFSVAGGEVLALMGENGAGKSTLLRLVAGLLIPDAGQLAVLGIDVAAAGCSFRRRVCYVNCDERSFAWRLTGRQNLEFFGALYGMRPRPARELARSLLERVGLRGASERPVREYSTGMRQRLAIARGMLGEPEVFLFDEPTSGIDPLGARELRRLIRSQADEHGATVIVGTHSFADVDALSDRVAVLSRGRLVGIGTCDTAQALLEQAAGADR